MNLYRDAAFSASPLLSTSRCTPGRRESRQNLAARHKLPPRHLETLLQGLVHAKILKGVGGPRGGYELARERRRITVGEIVRTAMSLSTADPEHPAPTRAARAGDRSGGAQGRRNLSRQSRFDHHRTHVRDGRESPCAR